MEPSDKKNLKKTVIAKALIVIVNAVIIISVSSCGTASKVRKDMELSQKATDTVSMKNKTEEDTSKQELSTEVYGNDDNGKRINDSVELSKIIDGFVLNGKRLVDWKIEDFKNYIIDNSDGKVSGDGGDIYYKNKNGHLSFGAHGIEIENGYPVGEIGDFDSGGKNPKLHYGIYTKYGEIWIYENNSIYYYYTGPNAYGYEDEPEWIHLVPIEQPDFTDADSLFESIFPGILSMLNENRELIFNDCKVTWEQTNYGLDYYRFEDRVGSVNIEIVLMQPTDDFGVDDTPTIRFYR